MLFRTRIHIGIVFLSISGGFIFIVHAPIDELIVFGMMKKSHHCPLRSKSWVFSSVLCKVARTADFHSVSLSGSDLFVGHLTHILDADALLLATSSSERTWVANSRRNVHHMIECENPIVNRDYAYWLRERLRHIQSLFCDQLSCHLAKNVGGLNGRVDVNDIGRTRDDCVIITFAEARPVNGDKK